MRKTIAEDLVGKSRFPLVQLRGFRFAGILDDLASGIPRLLGLARDRIPHYVYPTLCVFRAARWSWNGSA